MRNRKLPESERLLGATLTHRRPPRPRLGESPIICCADCHRAFAEGEEICSHGTHGAHGVRRRYFCKKCWESKFYDVDISDEEIDAELKELGL